MSIIDRFYSISPILEEDSNKYKYVDEHQKSIDSLREDLDEVKVSWYINKADGRELDEIGKIFGRFGKRRDRNDEDYRDYLQSITKAFSGRGRISDVEFVVNESIMFDTNFDNVEINEIFGEYIENDIDIQNQKSGSLEKTPIRYRDNEGNFSESYISWTDTDSNTELDIKLTNYNSLPSPIPGEVVIDWSTGNWKAHSNTSGNYYVEYEEKEMLAYDISIKEPWQSHRTKNLVEIVNLADASVSELRKPIKKILKSYNISISFSSVTNEEVSRGLGAGDISNNEISTIT